MNSDPRVERLTAAAHRKSAEKTKAAEIAIRKLRKNNEPVNFLTVAREARVSHSFLYAHPEIRKRIEHLRCMSPTHPPAKVANGSEEPNIVLALTQQIDDLKRASREEIRALKQALEKAHGENLALRRQLSLHGITPAAP